MQRVSGNLSSAKTPKKLQRPQTRREKTQRTQPRINGYELFKSLARQQGLIGDRSDDIPFYFFPMPGIVPIWLINPSPERLYELIRLARQCAQDDPVFGTEYGPHYGILRSAAYIDTLSEPQIAWHERGPHYTPSKNPNFQTTTVKEFLTSKGFDISEEALLK